MPEHERPGVTTLFAHVSLASWSWRRTLFRKWVAGRPKKTYDSQRILMNRSYAVPVAFLNAGLGIRQMSRVINVTGSDRDAIINRLCAACCSPKAVSG